MRLHSGRAAKDYRPGAGDGVPRYLSRQPQLVLHVSPRARAVGIAADAIGPRRPSPYDPFTQRCPFPPARASAPSRSSDSSQGPRRRRRQSPRFRVGEGGRRLWRFVTELGATPPRLADDHQPGHDDRDDSRNRGLHGARAGARQSRGPARGCLGLRRHLLRDAHSFACRSTPHRRSKR